MKTRVVDVIVVQRIRITKQTEAYRLISTNCSGVVWLLYVNLSVILVIYRFISLDCSLYPIVKAAE
jgi:hypothetical protein